MSFNYDEIMVDYYPARVWDTTVLGSCSLSSFLAAHKNPQPKILEIFKKIEKAAEEGDLKTKDNLKQNNLYYFALSCKMVGKRNYDSIVHFHPVMIVEFDKIEYAEELKQHLFEKLSCCIAAYLSPSKKGCKLLIRIPTPKTVDEYKEYYCGLLYYLSEYAGVDPANFNPALPVFLSYDYNILIRPAEEVTEWTQRGGKINAFKQYEGDYEMPEDINEEDKAEVIKIITTCFNRIVDNGHPSVLAFSTTMGGYVSAGYISVEEAEDLLYSLIENNDYLIKNVHGYQKTASEMLKRGMRSPLLLRRHENK